MAIADQMTCVEQIGQTAGLIWHALADFGPRPLTKLSKEIDAPRDVIMQALGWLAREGKIHIEDEGRSRVVSLRD